MKGEKKRERPKTRGPYERRKKLVISVVDEAFLEKHSGLVCKICNEPFVALDWIIKSQTAHKDCVEASDFNDAVEVE